jgi:hypothetical protein
MPRDQFVCGRDDRGGDIGRRNQGRVGACGGGFDLREPPHELRNVAQAWVAERGVRERATRVGAVERVGRNLDLTESVPLDPHDRRA